MNNYSRMENEPICATGPGIGRPTNDHWKPSYGFYFVGLSNFTSSVEGLVQIRDVDPRI